jgi:hypothetical protein
MVSCEDISRATHICSELVNIVNPVHRCRSHEGISQVSDQEFVRRTPREFGMLQIRSANPESFIAQAANEMAADKSAGSIH